MNDKWYNNIFGTGTNIFGAGPSGSVKSLLDAELINREAVEKAQKRSMSRGLLTGLASYLAQPKNQDYGSAVPYIAKGYLQGMEAAQSPYDSLESDAIMKEKLQEMKRQKEKQDLMDSLVPTKQVVSTKQENIAPFQLATEQNYNVGSQLMGALPYEKTVTSVAPDFETVGVNLPQNNLEQVSQLDPQVLEQIKFKYPELYNSIISNQKIESEIKLNEAKARGEGTTKSILMTPVEIAAEGLPTTNPDGSKAVWYRKDGQPINVSKTSGQNIDINLSDNVVNEDVGKVFVGSQNQGALAAKNLSDIRRMETLLSKADQGSLQGAITDAKALFERLNVPFVDIDTEKLGAEQAARALSNQLAIALRPPASGVMTDKDFEVFLESVPSIQNTALANKLMIEYAKDAAQRQQDLARKLREYKRSTVDAYGNPKKSGVIDDGIYEIVDKFWQDVALDREKKMKLKSGEIYGEPTISGGV